MLNAHTVQGRHADVFTYLHGNLDAIATNCHMPCSTGPDSLVFVSDLEQLATARERGAAVLIVLRDVADQVAIIEPSFGCCFSVKNVSMGMAVLLKHFDRKRERFSQWGERHPTAIVHESATLGADVLLGPYCVIGANTVIGDGCCIGSHVVVENDVRLGVNTVLHPHVFVGAGCELGGSEMTIYGVQPDPAKAKASAGSMIDLSRASCLRPRLAQH